MRFPVRLVGHVLVLVVGLGVLFSPLPLAGQTSHDIGSMIYSDPPIYSGRRISLLDAVRITLAHEPNIRLQEADVMQKQGIAQEATGQFDATLIGSAQFEYTQEEITQKVKKDEAKKRSELATDVVELGALSDEAQVRANEFTTAHGVLSSGGDLGSVTFTSRTDQANWDLFVSMYEPERPPEVRAVMEEWLLSEATASQAESDDAGEQRDEASRLLKNLGSVPKGEKTYRGNVRLELKKKYRTGLTFSPFVQLNGGGNNFIGKPIGTEFGGKGAVDNYKALVGFKVEIPLGRGRERESTVAVEEAAGIDHAASVAKTTHTAASSVKETMLAYWGLVAAQRNLEVHERSLELHRSLLEMSRRMVDGEQIARAELARSQAREAEARASVDASRRALHEARLKFARTAGLQVNDADQAPLALDDFPVPPDETRVDGLDASALARTALDARQDYRAALMGEQSGQVLYEASTLDLKRETNLEVEVSYSGRDEDSTVFEGIGGATLGNWTGPSGKATLTMDWPLGNNAQEGKRVQQHANYNKKVITARNLRRTIMSNVIQAVESLREATRQLEQFTEAASLYGESTEAEMEKFRRGLSTLIDAITTEQRQINAELALVNSRKQYAELLSTLRFETGTLVTEQSEGGVVSTANLLSLPPSGGGGR